MMNDGGPAFPGGYHLDREYDMVADGMTLRQYAAIKLRVPDSGTDWLDDMIQQSLRDGFAGQAPPPHDEATADWLADSLGWPKPTFPVDDRRAWFLWWNEAESAWNYAKADAMLKARVVNKEEE
jgi:hypothetical protein